MKKQLSIIFFFVTLSIFSQKEANFWYFGNGAALDFNSGVPVPVKGSQLNTVEGCSSFSDSNGELLFYVGAPNPDARNLTIWNKDNKPMPYSDIAKGGKTLKGDSSSSQSALTIPVPEKDNLYYLFTVGARFIGGNNFGFWYYTIDMTKDNGLGDVIDEPVALHLPSLKNQWSEKVTAVRASTCNTFWVISFARSNTFFAYKVDKNGVDTKNPVISDISGLFTNDPRGYLKVSPDGSKLVLANMSDGAFIFNFDDTTGKVTNYNNQSSSQQLNTNSENTYGIEFSASSKRLYISTGEFTDANESLFQFDITKPTLNEINNSKYTVHSYNNTRGALQLAPDNKIYWTSDRSTNISVINNPEELGAACNYSHQTVNLGGAIASQGLPPFLSSLLLPIEINNTITGEVINNKIIQKCIGESLILTPENVTVQPGSTVAYEWYFNKGATPITKTKNLTLNNLNISKKGDYQLKVSLTDECGNPTTLEGVFKLEIYEATNATQPTNILFCDLDNDGFNIFDLQKDVTPQVLNGQDPAIFEVKYFLSQAEADANNNALTTPYKNPTAFSNQTIYARMHNITAPNACYNIKEFTLAVTGKPVTQTPIDYEQCDDTTSGTDTDGYFNNFLLNTKDTEILGTLDAAIYNLSYHTTLIGAQTDNSTDLINKNIPYRNITSNTQTIYVRVENKNNTGCNDTSKSFNLVVNPLPIISNNIVTLAQCDTDPDLNTTINLTLAQKNISTNYTNETFKYYPTQNDAINDTSEITNQTAHLVTNGVAVWVRTFSDKNCYRISQIDIIVGYAADIAYTNEFNSCDDFLDIDGNDNLNNNDTDGITNFDLSAVITDVKALFPIANRQNLDVLIFENSIDRDAVNNQITNISKYRNKNIPAKTPQPLYIKIIDKTNNNCIGLGSFSIITNSLPNFKLATTALVCLNNPKTKLEVMNPDATYSYEWTLKGKPANILSNDTFYDVQKGGIYVVTAKVLNGTACKRSKEIIVNESETATLNDDDIVIVDNTNNNGLDSFAIKIITENQNLGIGDYQFSLIDEQGNLTDFQDEPLFKNITGGIYTVVVNDKNGCSPNAMLDVSVIEYPKFFTPNNDGINDTWMIKGATSSFYPSSNITIVDRHGKIVAIIPIDNQGWNGLYQGKILPSNDYWFKIELTDQKGKIHQHQGHFSLLRK